MRVPIVVYADFESFTKPIDTCQPNPDQTYTKQYQKHEPSGFCFHIVCNVKKLKPVLYTKQTDEENIGEIFVKQLEKEIEKVWSSEVKPMIMTSQDKIDIERSKERWICKKPSLDGDERVRVIAIALENLEERLIIRAIYHVEKRNMCLWYFTIWVAMIHISSSRVLEKRKEISIAFPTTRKNILVSQKVLMTMMKMEQRNSNTKLGL